MGLFENFPYTNFHEINLDQIIKIMRQMQDEWQQVENDWDSMQDFINNYFDNLDVSEEVLQALQTMAGDGELNTIIDPVIVTETAAWLTEHITPTSPAVDNTLSIAGAAADAKATGDAVADLKEDFNNFVMGAVPTENILIERRVNYSTAFNIITGLKVEAGKKYKIYAKNNDPLTGATMSIRIRNSQDTTNLFDKSLVSDQGDVPAGHEWMFEYDCKTTDTVTLQIYRTFLVNDANMEAGIIIDEITALDDKINNESYIIKTVAHRGASVTYPENTLIAFKGAKELGYKYIELDIRLTSDNVWVVLHDSTINRTARNADGTAISGDVAINSITYNQALTYDFGIWKGAEFAGTKIPTFEEALIFCKKAGIIPIFEVKVAFTLPTYNALIQLIRKTGMKKNVIALGPQGYLSYFTETDSDITLMLLTFTFGESVIALADSLKNDYNEVIISTDKSQYTPENISIMTASNYIFSSGTYTNANDILNIPNIIDYITTEELNAGEILYNQAMESI